MDNYKLGRQVLDQIDARTDQFEMAHWAEVYDEDRPETVTAANATECGMTACLGGWTMILAGYTYSPEYEEFRRPDGSLVDGSHAAEARRLLGMSVAEEEAYWDDPYAAKKIWFDSLEGLAAKKIWFDSLEGLARFRRLVEASENAAEAAGA